MRLRPPLVGAAQRRAEDSVRAYHAAVLERRLAPVVLAAALLALPALYLHATPSEPAHSVGIVAAWLVWAVFAGEEVLMLAVVADRRRWLRSHKLLVTVVFVSFPPLPDLLGLTEVLLVGQAGKLAEVTTVLRRRSTHPVLRRAALAAGVTLAVALAAMALLPDSATPWDALHEATVRLVTASSAPAWLGVLAAAALAGAAVAWAQPGSVRRLRERSRRA